MRQRNVVANSVLSFGGEVLDAKVLMSGKWETLDMAGYTARNSKEIRRDEIFGFARQLRQNYRRVGAIGFCFGGWAVLQLGAAEHNRPESKLVDCVSMAHPS